MGVINTYRSRGGSELLVNYSFTDMITGSGIVTYDGMTFYDSSVPATAFALNANPPVSFTQSYTGSGETNGYSVDKIFLLPTFANPRMLYGTANVVFHFRITKPNTIGTSTYGFCEVYIEKNGTSIASATTHTIVTPSGAAQRRSGCTVSLNIAVPKTKIAVGDVIGLHIKGHVAADAGSQIQIFHCPQNLNLIAPDGLPNLTIGADDSDGSTTGGYCRTSRLIFNLPFKIQ